MARKSNKTTEEVAKDVKETIAPAKKNSKKVDKVEEPKTEKVEESKTIPVRNYDFAAQRAKVEQACMDFNEAYLDKDMEKTSKIGAAIVDDVHEYTGEALNKCLRECASEPDPMLAAVKRLTFNTIGVKDNRDPDTGIISKEVVDKTKQIDLMKLHKMCGGIGHDKNWVYILERFNQLLTLRVAEELKLSKAARDDISDSYEMKEASRKIEFYEESKSGKTVVAKDPVSNRSLLKTLNSLVLAMVGPDFKAHSQDLAYLLAIYSKKSSKQALTVACAKHSLLRNYMAEICHAIVEGKHYNVEYVRVKK